MSERSELICFCFDAGFGGRSPPRKFGKREVCMCFLRVRFVAGPVDIALFCNRNRMCECVLQWLRGKLVNASNFCHMFVSMIQLVSIVTVVDDRVYVFLLLLYYP